ncbi:MAG: DEAD/DEAH box helicase [Bradymonadia bacterium]
MVTLPASDALDFARPPTRLWFAEAFRAPTRAQIEGWAPIARGESTVLLAPTGSGKTLAAFLVALDRIAFGPPPPTPGVRVLYISPLKALGVDVERNLRAPLAGVSACAERLGHPYTRPTVGVRTGDTPPAERARMARQPPDLLITTPESLYLWLTSAAAVSLRTVETVIVDEVHALLPTKRGAHLALSLERLEALRDPTAAPLQRIGLSATQRPLDEVARFLGGLRFGPDGQSTPRPVTVVDASAPRVLDLAVEMPVEDHLTVHGPAVASGPASGMSRSIWPAIYPRVVELILAHRSTLIFTNSRRLAERLANALNEVAGRELARAHHGSVSREERQGLEERLKAGDLPALVATSTLELGIDMGAIDLVIQLEAPVSVASGLQRIGRAGHQVGGVSKGVVFPKYRADLLVCAAVTARMEQGLVEETRYPRNPLDVAAQQLVAAVAMGLHDVEALWRLVRGAAPFAELPRDAFESLLDLACGQYTSHTLTDLRPSLVRDPVAARVTPRKHTKRLAILNGGTIPDRGLYGVFLSAVEGDSEGRRSRRVGELDEEMVLESRPGDVFVLGATAWRIDEITHDRVLVSPAPGETGRMPFWRGDTVGRAPELGEAVGALTRSLSSSPTAAAVARLTTESHLSRGAPELLLAWLAAQREATGEVPSDRSIVVERFRDEIGDWRVCVLTPYGARVHAPWATAVQARLRPQVPCEVEVVWSDDGFAFRLPELETLPDLSVLVPEPDEVEALVVAQLPSTSLFAARFRENAARALLLPRRSPTRRTPLWALRKRAQDLLATALRHPSFPIVLETYRECLRDVFDLPALQRLLTRIRSREVRVTHAETRRASPFAASLLFSYVQNFLYDGDTPPSERRARALTLDHARLKALLGEAELREIFEPAEIDLLERRLQRLEPRAPCSEAEGLHDVLWSLGDLSQAELHARIDLEPAEVDAHLETLQRARRVVEVGVGGARRFLAVEDVGRYRDALGVVPPAGTPVVFLEPTQDPLGDLVRRYARTHGPFRAAEVAVRLGTGVAPIESVLAGLAADDRMMLGAFRPDRTGLEACDPEVLRTLKRQALSRLRRAVEPVSPEAWTRFLYVWHGLDRPRTGLDGLLEAIEHLQGIPLPFSMLESEILPLRVSRFGPSMLDDLCISGEVVWRGIESVGESDARIALYLADQAPLLHLAGPAAEGPVVSRLREVLQQRGALRFAELAREVGGFPREVESALWALVWSGEVTNDTLAPLRSRLRGASKDRVSPRRSIAPHRRTSPGTEGRWSWVPPNTTEETTRRAARAAQALAREGVVVREAVDDFGALYPVLKAMEDAGRVRRGYFVEGLGATQFSQPGTEERLRAFREPEAESDAVVLPACDPANPWGAALPWPKRESGRPMRAAGTHVVLHDGHLRAWLGRNGRALSTFLPEDPPARHRAAEAIAGALAGAVDAGQLPGFTLAEVDGAAPGSSPLAAALLRSGFGAAAAGFVRRRTSSVRGGAPLPVEAERA